MIGFMIGVLLGGVLGIGVMAILSAAHREDEYMGQYDNSIKE